MAGNKRSGFASLSPERMREIAAMGGRAAHATGTAHEFTSQEAREAGRKGGHATKVKKAQVFQGEGEACGPMPMPVQTFDPQGD